MSDQFFHDDIQCFVEGVSYSFKARVGVLSVGENSSTDMAGAIRFFQSIHVDAEVVIVSRGANLDIVYRKLNGKWTARSYRGEKGLTPFDAICAIAGEGIDELLADPTLPEGAKRSLIQAKTNLMLGVILAHDAEGEQ